MLFTKPDVEVSRATVFKLWFNLNVHHTVLWRLMRETLQFPVAGVNDLPRDQHDDIKAEHDAKHHVHLPVGEVLDERQAESM